MTKRKISMVFWCGFVNACAVASLYQDYWGLEKMQELMADHWIDSSISVPIAIVVLVISVLAYADTHARSSTD